MEDGVNYIPIVVIVAVFLMTAIRQVGSLRLKIWHIMAVGALILIASGQVGLKDAIGYIDADVMFFLFGVFVIGEALAQSGELDKISFFLFKGSSSLDSLVLKVVLASGALSAFLMNDTIAIIGAPLVVRLARLHRADPVLLLLALCFGVTLGSVLSPIGNPQNLLIAIGAPITSPFETFIKYLAVPTIINLALAFVVLRFVYRRRWGFSLAVESEDEVGDPNLALLSKVSLSIFAGLVAIKAVLGHLLPVFDFRFTYIALISAAPILAFATNRLKVLRRMDWGTLVFFASMFIVMGALWSTGVVQGSLAKIGVDLSSSQVILSLSVLLSQVLSNVPFVALYLPVLDHLGATTSAYMALAAGSTIAGNLFILGAASNVIVVESAEKRGVVVSFVDFARPGVALTTMNVVVYWAYFRLVF